MVYVSSVTWFAVPALFAVLVYVRCVRFENRIVFWVVIVADLCSVHRFAFRVGVCFSLTTSIVLISYALSIATHNNPGKISGIG